ncbi:hypothetical protein J6S88_07515 [bacterium]|nr:hypothetical protein [bacterium]
MPVQSIQNIETPRQRRCTVGGALVVGVLGGNAVHDIVPAGRHPVTHKQIRNLVEYSYSTYYQTLGNKLKEKPARSLAQDTFVHLAESGNVHKNYRKAVESLGDNADAIKEFKELIWLADLESSSSARKMLNNHIKTMRRSRATMPFLIGGAIVSILCAGMYNYICYAKSLKD